MADPIPEQYQALKKESGILTFTGISNLAGPLNKTARLRKARRLLIVPFKTRS